MVSFFAWMICLTPWEEKQGFSLIQSVALHLGTYHLPLSKC